LQGLPPAFDGIECRIKDDAMRVQMICDEPIYVK
jgi:hypothetical protein